MICRSLAYHSSWVMSHLFMAIHYFFYYFYYLYTNNSLAGAIPLIATSVLYHQSTDYLTLIIFCVTSRACITSVSRQPFSQFGVRLLRQYTGGRHHSTHFFLGFGLSVFQALRLASHHVYLVFLFRCLALKLCSFH